MNKERNMKSQWRGKTPWMLMAMVVLLWSVQPCFGQSSETSSGDQGRRNLKGPSDVQNRIVLDRLSEDTLFELEFMQPYHEWKEQILEKYKYTYALDYYPIYMKATDNLPGKEDEAGSGVVRFSGFWQLYGGSDSTGTLIYLIEQRHRYTDNLPQSFAMENLGYAGFAGIPFGSESGLHLTNLYWSQGWQNGFGVAAGFLDITDFVDVYALTSPWTDFYNFVFSIGAATMDMPDDAALGFGGGGWLTDSVYLLAGMNDLNSDPTDPMEGFDTFFEDHEYFKYAEIGWAISNKEQYYLDNLHLTLWQADERDEIAIQDGWGTVLSFSHTLDDKWLLFARGGYAHDGGSLLERSVSIGGGYAPAGIATPGVGHQLGFGANWGQPNDALFGSGLDDQYSFEAYFRLQVCKEFSITPDVQLLINPALDPDEDTTWVFGLRARLSI
jgi:porin